MGLGLPRHGRARPAGGQRARALHGGLVSASNPGMAGIMAPPSGGVKRKNRIASSLTIRGGRIIALEYGGHGDHGSHGDQRVIDLKGRTAVPGDHPQLKATRSRMILHCSRIAGYSECRPRGLPPLGSLLAV